MERDPEAALPWLRRSINQGNDFAMIYLSQCHIEGEGVDEDPDAAFRLAERAAGRESSRALMHLAAVHAAGKGTEPDLARAIELLRGIEDNPWADNNLAWLLATAPDPEMHNGAEAVRIIRKALEQLVSEDIWIATDTLAAALARTGDFAAAVEAQQSALEQFGEWLSEKEREDLTDDDWSGKVRERAGEARERMEQRLAIYQSGRPVIVDPDSDEIQADELREQPAEEAPDSPEPVEENREPGMQDSDEAKDEAQAEPETRPRAVPRPRSRPGDADDEDGTPSKLRNFPRDPVPFEDEPRQTRPRDRILI